jgi:hypothetical protein
MDFMFILIAAIIGIGSAYMALKERSIILSFISGLIWFALGLYVLPENIIFGVASKGVGVYLWLRMWTG